MVSAFVGQDGPINTAERGLRGITAVGLPLLMGDYLTACKALGHSRQTVAGYSYALHDHFLPWLQEQGITQVDELNQRVLDRYSVHLQSRPRARGGELSPYTVAGYLRPVRHFITWLNSEGIAVAGRPRLPRLPETALRVLSREEINRLEDIVKTERDKLIIRLLGDCGLRVGELIALRPEDLVERDRRWYLYIRHRRQGGGAKGAKERFVPLGRLARRLKRYIDHGRPKDSEDRIFVSLRRDRLGGHHALTAGGVQQVVGWAAKEAGIGRRVWPHLLRHSLITHLLKSGMNPFQVSAIVGNFTQLAVYAHLTAGDAYEAWSRSLEDD